MPPETPPRTGPLAGLRVIEFAALGPAPMGTMFLADLGAQVLRIERRLAGGAPPAAPGSQLFDPARDILLRNREVLQLDLKDPASVALILRLVQGADVLIEGFRPGVMERLGLGPAPCLGVNPRLVYGRMTGWGQQGPLASRAGHDINYLSLSGALHAIGTPESGPIPPLNLVADCGGGAMLLAMGVLAALWEARQSGQGQVVDAAMTDGSALLMSMIYTFKAMGEWSGSRGENLLDGGAPFYGTYLCADGKWLALGAIEPQFYGEFLAKAGITDPDLGPDRQWDRAAWPVQRKKLAAVLAGRSRDEWCARLGGDCCVSPVLDLDEAPRHPHNLARQTFVSGVGGMQPAPAPRFSRTPPDSPRPPPTTAPGRTGSDALAGWGLTPEEVARLMTLGSL